MPIEAAPIVNESGLVNTIQEFIRSNRHSRDIESRWLCTMLEPLLPTIFRVRSGGLDPDERAAVNVFRATELQKQIESKRNETVALERELAKVRVI